MSPPRDIGSELSVIFWKLRFGMGSPLKMQYNFAEHYRFGLPFDGFINWWGSTWHGNTFRLLQSLTGIS